MSYYTHPKKTPRPKSVPNVSFKKQTGHSATFIDVGYLKDKKPFEVFIRIGHTDPCEKAYLEALARTISVGLQYGVPAQEYIKQLKDIECVPGWDKGNLIRSPADAIARALKEFINEN